MGKLTKYRKSWRWNRKKYFNYIARNYLKYTAVIVGKILWIDQDDNNIYWDGRNSNVFTLSDALAQAGNELLSLKSYFATMKFTGVAVKITPGYPANPTNANSGTVGSAFLTLQQDQEQATYANAVHNPRSICLSQFMPQRKYFSLTTSWVGTNAIPFSALSFVTNSNGRPMRDSSFQVQMLYKQTFELEMNYLS